LFLRGGGRRYLNPDLKWRRFSSALELLYEAPVETGGNGRLKRYRSACERLFEAHELAVKYYQRRKRQTSRVYTDAETGVYQADTAGWNWLANRIPGNADAILAARPPEGNSAAGENQSRERGPENGDMFQWK